MRGNPFPKRHIPWNKGKSHLAGEKHPMYGKHHSEESNKKNRIAHLGRKHSEETKRKISEANKGKKYGKNHPAWNKGFTKETDERIRKLGINSGKSRLGKHYQNENHFKKGYKPHNYIDGRSNFLPPGRYGDDWEAIRYLVYLRDNFTCQECEIKGMSLDVHHKIPFLEGGSNELDNLIALCRKCHMRIEQKIKRDNKKIEVMVFGS